MPAFWMALAACGGGGEAPAEAAQPSAWPDLEEAPAADEPELAVVEAGIAAFYSLARDLDAGPAVDAYTAMMAEADAGCPAWYEADGNTFWYAQCTADGGAQFDGYGFSYRYEDTDLYGDGSLWTLDVLYGQATVLGADGTRLHLGGSVQSGRAQTADGASVWQSAVLGSVEYDGVGAAGTWLSGAVDPDLGIYAYYAPTWDARYLYLDGQLAGLDAWAPGVSAVDAAALIIADPVFGWPCEEPAGAISVRDDAGTWVDVRFDVDGETWTATGACDGCGGAWRGEDYLGEVCVDPSALLDWGTEPW
jgi:hypothetical protein